jgi:hypothetical protein
MIVASMWLAKLSIEAIVGLIAASLAILAFVIDRVLGPATRLLRRRAEPRRLARALGGLRTGAQLQHFTDAIGQPPTRTIGNSNLYVLDDVFVDAETDDYGNVWRFAVTVRTVSFKPTMSMGGGGDVVLGETTYADLGLDGVAQGLMVMQSPAGRHTMYAESYYFGNPGNYQCWVVASNPASELGAGDLRPILNELGAMDVAQFGAFEVEAPFGGEMPNCWYTRPPIKYFRQSMPINTFSESGPHGTPDPEPGPFLDEVRVFMRPPAQKRPPRVVWGLIVAAAVLAIVAISLWIGWPVEP